LLQAPPQRSTKRSFNLNSFLKLRRYCFNNEREIYAVSYENLL
jgi:hypothetical protein